MIVAPEIELYRIIKDKLGDKEAEAIVGYVDQKIKESNGQNLKALATREYLANVKSEMIKWFVALFMALALMIIGLYVKK